MRPCGVQAVETRRDAVQRLSGQTKNQIRVQMGLRLFDQPAQIGHGFFVVLAPRNALLHLHIESLNPHFQLQYARWKLRYQGL